MVVVGFSGSLAMFWRLFFLMFRQSLWPASSEDSTLCSGVVGLGVEYSWLWVKLLSCSGDGWLVCLVVIRRRDYLSLWLMGVISWSFVFSDPQSLWLGRVRWSFARCIYLSWKPSLVELGNIRRRGRALQLSTSYSQHGYWPYHLDVSWNDSQETSRPWRH